MLDLAIKALAEKYNVTITTVQDEIHIDGEPGNCD